MCIRDSFLALSFYLANLGAPVPDTSVDPESAARGEARFLEAGCDSCHSPSLGGVPAYSDLLLHDMGTDVTRHVDQDPGVSPTEYRTPPLWGVRDTAPYLHDGSAPGILDAVLSHGGEGSAAREAVETMDQSAQQDLVTFLLSL